jgi:hypothetical protein
MTYGLVAGMTGTGTSCTRTEIGGAVTEPTQETGRRARRRARGAQKECPDLQAIGAKVGARSARGHGLAEH